MTDVIDINQTTLAPPPIEIPEKYIKVILKDFAEDLIAEVNWLILDLDTKASDSSVVMARRRALLDLKGLILNYTPLAVRLWRFPSQEQAKTQTATDLDKGKE